MSPLTTVLLGTSLLGCVAGVVGSFAVLRRRALVGDLLAHAALPGLCIAFLVMQDRHFGGMVVGAMLTGLAGVLSISVITRWTRTKDDAAIGIVLSTFFGAGVVLSSLIQRLPTGGGKAGLETYIYGQAAGIVQQDVWFIAGISVVALVVVVFLFKEFKVLSFDPEFASTQGWPTLGLDLAMMGTLALVTVVGLPAVGVVLMAAMLITPAAAARLWTNRLGLMLILAGLFGAAAATSGTLLSAGWLTERLGFDPFAFGTNRQNLPTGPLIVLAGTAIFLFSLLFAPERGLVARAWSLLWLRDQIEQENLLRSLFELSDEGNPEHEVARADLLRLRSWGPIRTAWLLRKAASSGLVSLTAKGAKLTTRGADYARRLTRRHRLWELFLIEGANIAPDHVDRDADAIEHLLPPEVVEELEKDFASGHGAAERATDLPPSPHELPPTAQPAEDRHG